MSVGAPDVQRAFGVDYTATALALFVVPVLLGALLEPPLLILADRVSRKPFVVGGLMAMGAGSIAAGLADDFWPFAIGVAVWFVANGLAVGAAQASVIDEDPDAPERSMMRWVTLGTLGDLAAPGLCAAVGALGGGWRGAFVASGAAVIGYGVLTAFARFEPSADTGDDEPTLRAALRDALANRRLLLWLVGAWTCGLLDELFVVFGSLHLRDALGADLGTRSLLLGLDVLGGLLGLLVARRLLDRVPPMRVLGASAALCLGTYGAWLFAPSIPLSAAAIVLLGAATAPLYPLAQAQAYRAHPGAPGTVHAVEVVFTPLDLAVPFLLGRLADAYGPIAALVVLALQPALLLALASFARDRCREGGSRA